MTAKSEVQGATALPPTSQPQFEKLILRQLFEQFIKSAERKLGELDYDALDKERNLSLSILPGADVDFDETIYNLAQIASHCPKLIIDSIMIWRGQRRNQAADLVAGIELSKHPNVSITDLENRIKRRISLMANFILCRVLNAIIQNLGNKPLNSELGKRLEDMVFGQLRSADPEQTSRFVNLEANVKLFSQLMGALSNTRFPTISDRFVSELRNIQASDKAATEGKLELLIKCMHYLKLKIYPMTALEESADFLQAITDLFEDSASTRIKLSLCELYNDLLEPVAKIADAELNVPVWQNTIEIIASKVMKLLQKGKNLNIILSLMTTLLTVSKKEYFLKNWPSVIETLISKFKERPIKAVALNSICKLLWTYLFRCFESPSSLVQKRIDYFSKVLFPPKKALSSSECNMDVFVRIVYYMLVKYPEYGNKNLITSLLTEEIDPKSHGETESFSLGRLETSLVLDELPNADRLFIALRAFLLILRDVERSISDKDSTTAGAVSAVQSKAGLVLVEGKINLTPPNFPYFEESSDYCFSTLSKIGSRNEQSARKSYSDEEYPLNLPLSLECQARMGISMRDTMKIVNFYVGQAFLSLENVVGLHMISEPPAPSFANPYITSQTGSSKSQTASGSHKYSSDSTSSYKNSNSSSTSLNSINGSGRASAVGESLNTFTGISSRQESFSLVELMERPPETPHQVYTRLLRTIMDSLPRFYPSGISPVTVIEMLSRYAVLHYDINIQQSAFESICRIAKANRIDHAGGEWRIATGKEMMSAAVFKIFYDATVLAIRSNFSELWVSGKFEEINFRLAEFKLGILDIWLEDVSTSTTYAPKQSEVDSTVDLVESQGLFYLCCMNANLRKTGIKILMMSQDFRVKLLEKMPITNVESLKNGRRVGSDSFERLSIFHGGKRASLYQRSKDIASEKKPYISIYDIMVDQGEKIVRENMSDSNLRGSSSDSAAEMLKAYNATISLIDNPLLHLAQSSGELDVILWNRCSIPFLKCLIEFASKECLKKTLIMVWGFLQIMQPILNSLAEEVTIYRAGFLPTVKKFEKSISTPSAYTLDSFVDYWRLYASFSYVCIEIYATYNEPTSAMNSQPFNNCSPGELNRNVLPLLSSGHEKVRNAALAAICCVKINGYGPLLRDIQPYMAAVVSDSQTSMKKQTIILESAFDRMRTQLAHLLTHVANFTIVATLRNQSNVMNTFHDYIKAMVIFFSDPGVQSEWKHQITRFYFCSFIEKYYNFLRVVTVGGDVSDIELHLGFKARKDLMSLFESWCGFGVDASKNRIQESYMISAFLESNKEFSSGATSSKIEIHRRSIQIASLKAMSALCGGPLIFASESLDVHRIISWINGMLETSQSTYQNIAKTAIENVLESNVSNEYLITEILNNCYTHSASSTLTTGYFLGLVRVSCRALVASRAKMATLAIFHLGSGNAVLRKAAGTLLFLVDNVLSNSGDSGKEGGQFPDWYYRDDEPLSAIDIDKDFSSALDYANVTPDVELYVPTSSVPHIYKQTQLKALKKVAHEHPELAMEVLNEVTVRIQSIKTNSDEDARKIKNLLLILKAWVSDFTLTGSFSVDRTHEFTSTEQLTWDILYNLFYLTARCSFSDFFAPDIQELWTELVSVKGKETLRFIEHQKQTKAKLFIVSDFLVVNAFSLQTTRAIHVTKNIAVILASSEFGAFLVGYLVDKLTPKSMSPIADSKVFDLNLMKHRKTSRGHTVDLSGSTSTLQNTGNSLCYLCMIQLSDCSLVLDKYLFILHLPVLLHVTITQLDSYKYKEEMRTMLVFLIQSVLSSDESKKKKVDPLLKALYLKEEKSVWKNEDPSPENREPESTGQMSALVLEVLDVFTLVHPRLHDDWMDVAIEWGTNCADSHTACRSLQIVRALKPKTTHSLLAQLCRSLACAVSDAQQSMQCLSLDLLLTISQLCRSLETVCDFPQFFWIALALLSSVHESEYEDGLKLLKDVMCRLDDDVDAFESLLCSMPVGFQGLLIPLGRGLCSSRTSGLSIELINMMLLRGPPHLLDPRPSKMMFVVLANLPQILAVDVCEQGAGQKVCERMASSSQRFGAVSLYRLFTAFSGDSGSICVGSHGEFLRQLCGIIKDEFGSIEGDIVEFVAVMLSNAHPTYPSTMLCFLEVLWGWRDVVRAAGLPSGVLWMRPLVGLLRRETHGRKAARVLSLLMGGSVSSASAIASTTAQSMYSYVKTAGAGTVNADNSYSCSETGWSVVDAESMSTETKNRILKLAKG